MISTRRSFLKYAAAFSGASLLFPSIKAWSKNSKFEVKRITDGKHNCWFGYYDKFQIDPSGRYALGCRVLFEGRSPEENDILSVGIIDLEEQNRWTEIGTSKAWGWQQGCMLQWVPGMSNEIIWNDREGDQFVSRIYNTQTKKVHTLPKAVYALSPDGTFAVGTEFNRIQNLRPGYGYSGINDPYEKVMSPDQIGLYRMDLKTGEHKLLISIAALAKIPHNGETVLENWHWFNHLLVSPNSRRIMFLHRWRKEKSTRQLMATGGFITRMITIDTNGNDLYVLDPSGFSSHFVWRDPKHLFVWTKPINKDWGFWVLEDKTQNSEIIGKETMTRNGHNTYVPNTNNEWVLNDTYPDEDRNQTLYLYHIPTKKRVVLGKFYSPDNYQGEWRCDLHPRCNQQGTVVYFDSTHEGAGRQMYKIDISAIVG